jgi:hypothetical protein
MILPMGQIDLDDSPQLDGLGAVPLRWGLFFGKEKPAGVNLRPEYRLVPTFLPNIRELTRV